MLSATYDVLQYDTRFLRSFGTLRVSTKLHGFTTIKTIIIHSYYCENLKSQSYVLQANAKYCALYSEVKLFTYAS